MNIQIKEEKAFLGKGWSFPPTFDLSSRALDISVAEKDIQESLHILLTTRIGERIMQPRYGCNLEDYVFENINRTFVTFIYDLVETAILYFEPRIDLENVFVRQDNVLEGMLEIEVVYRIRATNTRSNVVFPFYKTEGNNI
jgi:phage baseplate assembly protein W